MHVVNYSHRGKERRLLCLLGLYETAWLLEPTRVYTYLNFNETVGFYNELVGNN